MTTPTAIAWVQSERVPEWTYGYVGKVRAFCIENLYSRASLQPHLPGPTGYPAQEIHPSVEAAKARAVEILRDFLVHLGEA
ncbi:hypothetical protein ACIBG7_15330 [Nonomuraea sp. NPDC050328]|uniref:hypothetical protein n=1 Tax=Nonomuraea sp. NPDC050328 TaxID=3364361 RepID=UPI0037AA24DA